MEYRVWEPEGEIKGIVQLLHGMAEHIHRYDRMAKALNAHGYLVVGHNHRGHGPHAEKLGYFAAEHGWDHLIEDAHQVTLEIKERYPGKKLVLLGHSMGSFAAREYAIRYGTELEGLVLSGTGYYPALVAGLGKLIAKCCPKDQPAPFVDKIAFSANNKAFKPARTPFDWLSRDEMQVDQYIADPLCGFLFTGQAYADFFGGLMQLTHTDRLQAMPKDLPVFFLSGDHDPVGQMGKGVQKTADQFKEVGIKHVTVKLYPMGRHEMFNEINKEEVDQDLRNWLDSVI